MDGKRNMTALSVVPEKQMAQSYLRLARQYARQRKALEALDCYVSCFMARFGELLSSPDDMWDTFFRHQFSRYLVSKPALWCSLPEGDMVHDYLKDRYIELRRSIASSQIPFKGNIRLWLDDQRMDFPSFSFEFESF